ncbi:hypothetical protein LI055_10480 [Clostridium perfringens]|uniref:hypothetical protein n=1 Tax=Clostridium perfringens TaxID=1502 RepID=UPI002246323F|nr:hypothetical protein [Clostridium perfringens]MCX0380045.1 hypothetical protein [Clostridium perfringens]MDK0563673.1 hypothetical protein [Clostridium perfringens]MDK0793221.1 hypothetical protein [Clostridium perfringens]
MNKTLTKVKFVLWICLIILITLILINMYNFSKTHKWIELIISTFIIIVMFVLTIILYKSNKEDMISKNYNEQLDILFYNIKKLNFENKIKKIIEDYIDMNEKDKVLLENELNDFIVDIDKIAWLSLVVFIIPIAMKQILEEGTLVSFLFYSTLYITLGVCIVINVKKYRFYKMYLMTIKNLRNKNIVVKKENGKISLIYNAQLK